jgi:hypothetical protein
MPTFLQATRGSYITPPKFNKEVRNTSRSVSSDVGSPYFRSVGSFTVAVLLIPVHQSFVKILKKRKKTAVLEVWSPEALHSVFIEGLKLRI